MNKEFIPYSEALELKELGFDEHCFMIYYVNNILNRHFLLSQKNHK